MAKTTAGVRKLVRDVLSTFPKPYSDDITYEVCTAIQNNTEWRQRYTELSSELRHWVVNNWIGQYVAELTGRKSGEQVVVAGSLIGSYRKLHA